MPNSKIFETSTIANGRDPITNKLNWHKHLWPSYESPTKYVDHIRTLDFAPKLTAPEGHHVRSGGGNDVFNFTNLANVTGTLVGRLEDFDPTHDKIQINGVDIDFNNLPSNVRIVSYNGNNNDAGSTPQQWLLINTSTGGHIFYALEGARVDLNGDGGSNEGDQEIHFITTFPNFSALTDVQYINPFNFVPSGYQPDGGLIINDISREDPDNKWSDEDMIDVNALLTGTNLGDLIAGGLNDDKINSGAGNDRVWGGDGHDTIYGAAGNDTLYGNAGSDNLSGDTGNDFLDGGAGTDLANYSGATPVNVNLTTGLATGMGSDTLSGIEHVTASTGNDSLIGNSGQNILNGNQGNDQINGMAGADRIYGGAGTDVMWAGAADGAVDTFIYNAISDSVVGTNRDQIAQFSAGTDEFDLRNIDANTAATGNQAFNFSGTTAAANSVWYTTSGTSLIVCGDNNGDGQADFEIRVLNVSALTAGDFLL